MKTKTFQEILDERFEKFKNNTAIECGSRRITYGELAGRSNFIGARLKRQLAAKNTLIGIAVDDKIDFVSILIAVLKAGGIFVPIDPVNPLKRREKMITVTNLSVIIADEDNYMSFLSGTFMESNKIDYILMSELSKGNERQVENAASIPGLEKRYSPDDQVYIYFTSGSTSEPKAIVGKNKSFLQYIQWEVDTINVMEGSRFSQLAPVGFDAFLKEVFVTLFSGGALCIPEDMKILLTPEALTSWLENNKINLLHCVPSLFRLLISGNLSGNNLNDLQFVLLSGERVYPSDLKKWYEIFDDRIQIFNLYGSTETTILKTYYSISRNDVDKRTIPIGKPTRGARVIILDENLKLCSTNVIGEIYIRTPYLTAGYLNDPDLTAQKYVKNPFSSKSDDIIFKTGDLGRLLADGNIEFLERIDRQVKVRGNRIDLGEIQDRLLNYKKNPLAETELEAIKQSTISCKNCFLTSAYPGLSFNDEGVCNICEEYGSYKDKSAAYFKNMDDFENLIRDARKTRGGGEYDCLLLYSGGKDSSYTLFRLVDMGLKVLTFTFDNGYISDAAFENIKKTTAGLNVENIIYKIDNMDKVFVESLVSDHTVCSGCFKAVTAISTKIALERGINVVITGLSRGQIYETKLEGLFRKNIFEVEEIEKQLLLFRKVYHSLDDRVSRLLNITFSNDELEKIHFVDFFRYDDTPIYEIKNYLRDKGWNLPGDTGFCSTNCIINDVGIYIHFKERGYHNYAAPLSWDYRVGLIKKETGRAELDFKGDLSLIRQILDEIGYAKKQVTDAVVIAGEDETKNSYLSAYFVSPYELSAAELREYLAGELPDYMIPAYFKRLEEFPRLPNGKVDLSALPDISKQKTAERVPPRDEIEEKLIEIWEEVLYVDKDIISIDSDFFEFGGHSLNVMSMIAIIHREFDVRLSLENVFNNNTIEKLAEFLRGSSVKLEKHATIEPVEKKEYYALSAAQKRLYILQQMLPGSIVYNNPILVPYEEGEKGRLEKIFRLLINRHESLRTSIIVIDNIPVQKVKKPGDIELKIDYFDLTAHEEGSPRAVEEQKKIINDFVKPFDLSRAPFLRLGIIRFAGKRDLLLIDIHHIVTDYVSSRIIIRDLQEFSNDMEPCKLRLQYKDYTEWQNDKKQREAVKKQEEYWLEVLAGELPVIDLITDYPRPVLQSFAGDKLSFEIGEEETKALKDIAGTQGATLYMIILALYNVLLFKITSQEDIIIGAPVSGRRHVDLENIVGMMVNTLPLRNRPRHNKTFLDFLIELKGNTLKAFENQEYQFEELVEKVSVVRDIGRNPIFDIMFSFFDRNEQDAVQNVPGTDSKKMYNRSYSTDMETTAKFDLLLTCIEAHDRLYFSQEYCTSLFKKETIERYMSYFKMAVTEIVKDPGQKIEAIDIISPGMKNQILYDFNDTGMESDCYKDKTINRLFEDQVEKTPDSTALEFSDTSLSYRQLNDISNRLALLLQRKGVDADKVVAIMAERSLEMVTGIFGILKAGGAYLPIDPNYPEERKLYMLRDSNSKQLLTTRSLGNEIEKSMSPGVETLYIEKIDGSLETGFVPAHNSSPLQPITPLDSAYVIYTSGSTGKPKGVMVEHNAVVNLLSYLYERYPFVDTDAYLLKTNYVFDVSVSELFGWFMGGGKSIVLEKDAEKSPHIMLNEIEKNGITHINFVPSMFGVFVEMLQSYDISKLSSLKYIFLAGEALKPKLVEDFQAFNLEIVMANQFGPTEGTVYCSEYLLSHWDGESNILIGKPIKNVRLYILDRNDNLSGIGIPGELCIAGTGLAWGYLNNPFLTMEKFVTNPYMVNDRLYKTGDLARWLNDGNIEFLGRMDHQVKVRGFRVEPAEIETSLLRIEEIKEAVVLDRMDKEGRNYLCAYIVADKKLKVPEIKTEIAKTLPNFMIPSHFVFLNEIPMTESKKVDRKALPAPGIIINEEYAQPRSEIERKLTKTWSEVLEIDENLISRCANFFDIGGHSLTAAILTSMVYKEFGVTLPLAQVFKTPTIYELAVYIKKAAKEKFISIQPVEKKEYYNLSSAQRRIYIIQQLDLESTDYNITQVIPLPKARHLNKDRLEDTFKKLICRHESLRTSFKILGDEPIQRIEEASAVAFSIGYLETRNRDIEQVIRDFARRFDLSNPPLLRVDLVKIVEAGELQYILLVDLHHIIADGISMELIIKNFLALYSNDELQALRIQYRDFAYWESNKEQQEMKKQEEYWLNVFAGENHLLKLPTDYNRPNPQSHEVNVFNFEMGEDETTALQAIMRRHNATMFMVLLTLYNILLAKLSDREDIVVGAPVSGRRHPDLNNIVGMLANTLALKNFINSESTYSEILEEIKQNYLDAFDNQDFQFDDLVDKLALPRTGSSNPLFNVVFTHRDYPGQSIDMERKSDMSRDNLNKYIKLQSEVDMLWITTRIGRQLFFHIEYNRQLFKEESIARFVDYFKKIVSDVLEDDEVRVNSIMFPHNLLAAEANIQDANFKFNR